MPDPVIIEIALNGGTPKSRNPNSPRTPDEIAADGIACIEAGAAIVHNHNDEPVIGRNGVHSPVPYEQAWRQILAKDPDAILYPTMAGGGPHTNIAERYAHIPALAGAGVLGFGLVDPGSTNFGGEDADGLPAAVDVLYQNTYADARHMFAECTRLGVPASISIFEPGFLRVALAYQRAGKMPPGSLIKLYFSGRPLGFGLPPTLPSLQAYLAMLEGTGLPWSVAVLGGDVIASGLARLALERGGHVRVGLEDYAGPRKPSNVELVREAVSLCKDLGRPVASCSEAAKVLGMAAR
jgi:3-keto-5-aminohexanoate cleavage enzyme